MIQENLIAEYSGTTFSVTKVDGVSKLTFADNPNNVIDAQRKVQNLPKLTKFDLKNQLF